MNWNWPHKQQKDILKEKANSAEARLMAIKKAAKTLKKSVEDSLKTAPGKTKNESVEVRKRKTAEFILGESVGLAVQALKEEKIPVNIPPPVVSPLTTILERYANLEKTLAHMLTTNEMEIMTFISSNTPISKLLSEDIPAVNAAKKELEQINRRETQCSNNLDREIRKLDKMANEEDVDEDRLNQQREIKDKVGFEVDNLRKDLSQEHDKLTSSLMKLVSRENRYAESVLELIKLKKSFYENAFKTIEAELPNVERILKETNFRPVFGEHLEDHLRASHRSIAYPIALSIRTMIDSGLQDEGLFRISPKQIKLDKFKACMDCHDPPDDLLQEGDIHLHAALLKSYLRELPVPLLGGRDAYDRWIQASVMRDERKKINEFRSILNEEISPQIVKNIQYVIKFLQELSKKSKATKMTPRNIAIVLGPNLLWSDQGFETEQGNLENIIAIVATMIECYHTIFPEDISFSDDLYSESTDVDSLNSRCTSEPGTPCGLDGYHLQKSASASPSVIRNNPVNPGQTLGAPVPAPRTSLCMDNPSPNYKRKSSIRTMGSVLRSKISTGNTLPPPPSNPPPSLPFASQPTPPPTAPRPTSICLPRTVLASKEPCNIPQVVLNASPPKERQVEKRGSTSSHKDMESPDQSVTDRRDSLYRDRAASLGKRHPTSSMPVETTRAAVKTTRAPEHPPPPTESAKSAFVNSALESPRTVMQATATTASPAKSSANGATAR